MLLLRAEGDTSGTLLGTEGSVVTTVTIEVSKTAKKNVAYR